MNKPPAFQFYASDFLQGTSLMTPAEVGAYIRLLAHSWCSGFVPKSPELRARIIGADLLESDRLWLAVRDKFLEADFGFINERLEQERRKSLSYRKLQAKKMRDYYERLASGEPVASYPSLSSSSSSSSPLPSGEQIQTRSSAPPQTARAKPPADTSAIVLTFPVRGPGGPDWALTQRQVDEWHALYGGLDVLAQCRQAYAWVGSKPANKKTAGGMTAFLVRWLNRAVNDGRGSSQRAPAYAPRRTAAEVTLGTLEDLEADRAARR